jgi:hypothetical protein
VGVAAARTAEPVGVISSKDERRSSGFAVRRQRPAASRRSTDGDGHLGGDVVDPGHFAACDEAQELELGERKVVLRLQPGVEPVVEPRLQSDQVREQRREISHR